MAARVQLQCPAGTSKGSRATGPQRPIRTRPPSAGATPCHQRRIRWRSPLPQPRARVVVALLGVLADDLELGVDGRLGRRRGGGRLDRAGLFRFGAGDGSAPSDQPFDGNTTAQFLHNNASLRQCSNSRRLALQQQRVQRRDGARPAVSVAGRCLTPYLVGTASRTRVSLMRLATTAPEANVKPAAIYIAALSPRASAVMPATIAPTA